MSPTQIIEEQMRLPDGFLEEIIEARAYCATKNAYDSTQKGYEHPLLLQVKLIESELVQEAIDRRKKGEDDDG